MNELPVAYFKGIEKKIIEMIRRSNYSIKIAMAWFTNSDIKDCLIEVKKSHPNIEIIIVVDDNEINKKYFLNSKSAFEDVGIKIKSKVIIVYQDPCFDIEGFRYLLNDRFEKLKWSRVIPEDCFVKEFVMVPLEILIKLEDYFADGILQLDILIDNYIVECKKSEQNKLLPFNKYIMRQAKEKGYREGKSSRFQNILNSFVEKKLNKIISHPFDHPKKQKPLKIK